MGLGWVYGIEKDSVIKKSVSPKPVNIRAGMSLRFKLTTKKQNKSKKSGQSNGDKRREKKNAPEGLNLQENERIPQERLTGF